MYARSAGAHENMALLPHWNVTEYWLADNEPINKEIATKTKNNFFFIYNEFKGLIIHCKCVNK